MCEETLAAHKSRLGELKGLVARIANDVGLEAGGLLEAEVDALGKRLEDVRESLATLVEAAESKVASKDLCTDDLLQTKSYLSSVQQVRNKYYFIVFSVLYWFCFRTVLEPECTLQGKRNQENGDGRTQTLMFQQL